MRPRFTESLRGADVFIIQSHYGCDGRSVNDAIMEQLIMIDAAYRASAKRITAVCPFYGYARQDRKASGREPITARLVANMLKVAGAKRMISVDLHSGQIQGFFDGPVDHLTAMPVLEDYLRANADDPVIVSPDAGRIKVAERYAQHSMPTWLHLQTAPKGRRLTWPRPGDSAKSKAPLVLIDDMIDTAGTIVSATDILLDRATEVGPGHTRCAVGRRRTG
jgi:ribose-phosphate pyrophosphokinase